MLFSGCWAVRRTPAVCAWVRSTHDRGSRAPNRSRMMRAHIRRAAPELGDFLEKVAVHVEEERQPRRKRVDVQPCRDPRLHVRDPVRERERELLHRGRARLADVVPADADRCSSAGTSRVQYTRMSWISFMLGRGGTIHSFCAMNSLSMSAWIVPPIASSGTPRALPPPRRTSRGARSPGR